MTELQYEFAPLEDIDEQEAFLNALYHDSRGGSMIRMDKDGDEIPEHFARRDWHDLMTSSPKHDEYVAVNTFRSNKRTSEEVYNYTGIYIDLDDHSDISDDRRQEVIKKTEERLRKAYIDKELCEPTTMTETGRGLGILYILERSIANLESCKNQINQLQKTKRKLVKRYEEILAGDGLLKVDKSVQDDARICRMPLTFNHKANKWCRLVHISLDEDGNVKYCTLKKIIEESCISFEKKPSKKTQSGSKVFNFKGFLDFRLAKLNRLQAVRGYNCNGCREVMSFVFYNAAKQVMGEDQAREQTLAFNERFSCPLSEKELNHAIRSTNSAEENSDGKRYYKISDAWIIESLGITDKEKEYCGFGMRKRSVERKIKKEGSKQARNIRNVEIAEYIVSHPKETYLEIANTFCVSKSTISRIVKEYGINRNRQSKKNRLSVEIDKIYLTTHTDISSDNESARLAESTSHKKCHFLSPVSCCYVRALLLGYLTWSDVKTNILICSALIYDNASKGLRAPPDSAHPLLFLLIILLKQHLVYFLLYK